MVESIDRLRHDLKGSAVTLDAIEAKLGAEGTRNLRKKYFPRWRRSRANPAAESLRGFKALVVEDEFEREVVQALAPRELKVKIRVSRPEPELARAVSSGVGVRSAL